MGRLVSSYIDYDSDDTLNDSSETLTKHETWIHVLHNGNIATHVTNRPPILRNADPADCNSVAGFAGGSPYIAPPNSECYTKNSYGSVVITTAGNPILKTNAGTESLWDTTIKYVYTTPGGTLKWYVIELEYLGDIQEAEETVVAPSP